MTKILCKKTKAVMTALLVGAVVILGTLVLNTSSASATSSLPGMAFSGDECSSNSYAIANINYLNQRYPELSTYPGTGTCWGYANTINQQLASSSVIKDYTGLVFNVKNFKATCLYTLPGTHLRLSTGRVYNGYSGHSLMLMKVTPTKVYWSDNNGMSDNRVRYYTASLTEFVDYYSYGEKYINRTWKPTAYRADAVPKLSTYRIPEAGYVRLCWTKTTSTSYYRIYRSYRSNGGFVKIASIKGNNYVDKTAPAGKQVYYRIKSVRSGIDYLSNIGSRTRRLSKPEVTSSHNILTGQCILKWNSVKGTDHYSIYKMNSNYEYKWVKSTTALSYTDTSTTMTPGTVGIYKVYAVASVSSGNSLPSDVQYVKRFLARPNVSVSHTGKGYVSLTWKKSPGATSYQVYRYDNSAQKYVKVYEGAVLSYTDKNVSAADPTHMYKVRAYSYYNWADLYSYFSLARTGTYQPKA